MDEFIVWDNRKGTFVHDTLEKNYVVMMSGKCLKYVNKEYETYLNHDDSLKAFKSIGRTDIYDKKIFESSSVFEFDFGTISGNKVIGYFKYSTYSLSYEIHLIENRNRVFNFDESLMKNFKIIDTLQENPELLK